MATASPPIGLTADPAIPSRDLLLDPDSVAEQIGVISHHEGNIESCTLRWVKYRIGESLSVLYDVTADGRPFMMSARTFANSAAVFRKAERQAGRVEGMPGVAHDPRTDTVWWTLPNDPRLRNLATLLDPPLRVRQSSGVAWDQSVLVEYVPEESATARLLDAHGQVTGYAKGYRDRDALEIANQYNRVAASVALLEGIRTPRALGWARPDRIVVLEPMRGRMWSQLTREAQPVAMQHLGAALANVHGLPADFGRGRFQRYRAERIAKSAELVAMVRPDVAAAAHRLRDRLAKGPPAREAIVCLHGDIRANNILFDGDQVHVLDFDEGGSGAASVDLGSMLASLITAQLVDPATAADALRNAFLEGYATIRPLPNTEELRWYTAAACVVERASGAVTDVNEPTLAVLPELLEAAETILAGKREVGGLRE